MSVALAFAKALRSSLPLYFSLRHPDLEGFSIQAFAHR